MNGSMTENESSNIVEAAAAACTAIDRIDVGDLRSLVPSLTRLLHAAECIRQCAIEVHDANFWIEHVSLVGSLHGDAKSTRERKLPFDRPLSRCPGDRESRDYTSI